MIRRVALAIVFIYELKRLVRRRLILRRWRRVIWQAYAVTKLPPERKAKSLVFNPTLEPYDRVFVLLIKWADEVDDPKTKEEVR